MIFISLLAFLLGVKHSYDADHIVAVSSLLTKTRSLRQTVKMSVSWALGHMVTAAIITVILYYFRESFLSTVLGHFDSAVAIMLIALGVFALKDIRVVHRHEHQHDGRSHLHPHAHLSTAKEEHYHRHMFGIGIVHGLASNDELLVLFTISLSVTTLFGILAGLVIFSFGVVLGMIAYSVALNYPITRFGSDKLGRAVNVGTGLSSLVYGAALLSGVV